MMTNSHARWATMGTQHDLLTAADRAGPDLRCGLRLHLRGALHLEPEGQTEGLVGLSAQVSGSVRNCPTAATDPLSGVSRWGITISGRRR